jgi:hypothetical protein
MKLVLDHVQWQASTLTMLNLRTLQPDNSLSRKMNTMEIHCVDGKWMVLPQESVQGKAVVLVMLKYWSLLSGGRLINLWKIGCEDGRW